MRVKNIEQNHGRKDVEAEKTYQHILPAMWKECKGMVIAYWKVNTSNIVCLAIFSVFILRTLVECVCRLYEYTYLATFI